MISYIITLLLSVVYMGVYVTSALLMIKKKEHRLIVALILSLLLSISWCKIFFDMFNNTILVDNEVLWGFLYCLFLLLKVIVIFCVAFLFLSILWTHTKKTDINLHKMNTSVAYTTETLLGVEGTIVSYNGNNMYLGKLNDAAESSIVVRIVNTNVSVGDKFIVDSFDFNSGYINAKLI